MVFPKLVFMEPWPPTWVLYEICPAWSPDTSCKGAGSATITSSTFPTLFNGLGNLSYFLNTMLESGAVGSDSQAQGFCAQLSHVHTAQRPVAREAEGPWNPFRAMLTTPHALALHYLSLEEKGLWLLQKGTGQLTKFVPTTVPSSRGAGFLWFPLSHPAQHHQPWHLDQLFLTCCQEVPCGCGDITKDFSTGPNTYIHLSLNLLAWKCYKGFSPLSLFLGKRSRRTSEKETGLLKSGNAGQGT